MKNIFLAIIVFISIAAFYGVIPSTILVGGYGMLAIVPLLFIYLKRNLVNTLLLWFFLLLFKDLGKIGLYLIPDITPERIIWSIIIVSFSLDVFSKKRKIVSGDFRMEIAMFLIVIYILFSKIFAGTLIYKRQGLQLSLVLSGFIIPFSIFFLAKNLIDDEQKIRKVFLFLSIIGLYLGITGIFENFQLRSFIFPDYINRPDLGIHYGQARGPFLNASVNGLTIGLIFFSSLYFYQTYSNKWIKRLISLSILSMLGALLFTYNRASWIGFFAASLLIPIFYSKVRKQYIAGLLLIIVASSAIIVSSNYKMADVKRSNKALDITAFDSGGKLMHRFVSTRSMESRTTILEAAWRMFLDKPLLGFGYQRFKLDSTKYLAEMGGVYSFWNQSKSAVAVHNALVQLLVELGLVGVSLFLFILFYPLVIAKKLYQLSPSGHFFGKEIAIIFFMFFIFYFIVMQGMEFHYFLFPNAIYYMLAGMISGSYQRYKTDIIDRRESLP